jgi:hypothetical protein
MWVRWHVGKMAVGELPWNLSHLSLATIVDITILQNNGLTAQQNQIDWNHKIKQIP